MKKIIILLLSLILIVLTVGVWFILTDEYDENVANYIDVQLYELNFDERFDTLAQGVLTFVEELDTKMNDEEHEITIEDVDEEYKFLIKELNTLKKEIEELEFKDDDIRNINGYLVQACDNMRAGIDKVLEGYKENNPEKFMTGIDYLLLSEEDITYWQDLILAK